MMANSNLTVPKLRFPGFNDEWRTSTLESLFMFKNGLGKGKEFFGKGTPIINFSDVYHKGSLSKNNINGLVEVNQKEKNNFSARRGDTFFTRTSETPHDIGMSSTLVEDIHDCVFSGFVLRARPKNNVLSPKYRVYCFSTNSIRKEIVTKSSFTTRALTSGTLLNGVVLNYPNSLDEQQKIAGFLTKIDKKINFLQKKMELFEEYKKGMMQAIFSQNIRFKDENGNSFPDWQPKKIGGVFEECTGRGGKDKKMLSVTISKGVIPFSSIERKDNSSADKSTYKNVEVGDIAYNSMRMWQGASGVSKFSGFVSPAYTVIRPIEGNVSNFWGYYFKLPQVIFTFQRYSQGLTSDTWNLKFGQLSEIQLPVPDKEEQKKIADFLTSIDHKIELAGKELEQAKQFKKALFQQMFV